MSITIRISIVDQFSEKILVEIYIFVDRYNIGDILTKSDFSMIMSVDSPVPSHELLI